MTVQSRGQSEGACLGPGSLSRGNQGPNPGGQVRKSSDSQPNQPLAAAGWRTCVPELAITVLLVIATCAAVYGYAGAGAAVITLTVWAVVLVVALRVVLPVTAVPPVQQATWQGPGRTTFTGFWRSWSTVSDATANMASYDAELRPTLQHLLAARLAERHDVNLYQDPETARRLLFHGSGRGARADQIWFWLDPSRPAETRQQMRGVPPRTLAAIIDRLEQL